MIYLIKHLSKTYDIIVSNFNDLPTDFNHVIVNSTYTIDSVLFANIIYMPTGPVQGLFKPIPQNMELITNRLYEQNHEEILSKNKNKFIITVIQFKPDNTKDVLYANSYVNLLSDATEYNKLLANSPMHHYEILNYKTEKFEVFIKKDDAIEKLQNYINEFLSTYRPNIVKEFYSKQQFLEYIK